MSISEYKEVRGIMTTCRKQKKLNGKELPKIIHDACNKALDSLDDEQRSIVVEAMNMIMDNTEGIGEAAALETLAAVSFMLDVKI